MESQFAPLAGRISSLCALKQWRPLDIKWQEPLRACVLVFFVMNNVILGSIKRGMCWQLFVVLRGRDRHLHRCGRTTWTVLMAGWSKGLLQNYWRSVNSFVGPLMHRELLMPMAVGIFGLKWMRRCCMSWWRMPGHGRFSWRFRRERILRAFRVSTDESFSKHMHEYVLTSCTLFGASKMDPSWSPHSMSSTTWAKPQLALSVVLLIPWNIDALRVPDVNMFMPNIMGFCRSGPHSQRQSKYIFYHRKIPTGSLANRRLCRWRINGTDRRSTLNQNYVIFLLTVPVMEGRIDSIN